MPWTDRIKGGPNFDFGKLYPDKSFVNFIIF